jgi:hypothetical protein
LSHHQLAAAAAAAVGVLGTSPSLQQQIDIYYRQAAAAQAVAVNQQVRPDQLSIKLYVLVYPFNKLFQTLQRPVACKAVSPLSTQGDPLTVYPGGSVEPTSSSPTSSVNVQPTSFIRSFTADLSQARKKTSLIIKQVPFHLKMDHL